MDLGLMPGSIGTEGRAINNNNQVVGIAWYTSTNSAGFVRRGFFWQNGAFIDLGLLPGFTEAFPHDISDDGTVVGVLGVAPGQGTIPFIWKAGSLRRLMDFVPVYGAAVQVPRAINSAGQIASSVIIDGDDIAVRMRPTLREPGDTNCDMIVNVNDLLTVITQWGLTGVDGDVNADFIVNVNDLLMVVTNWG